jgi:hypothetical protein
MSSARLELLDKCLNEQIEIYNNRKHECGWRARRLKQGIIVCSVTITILIGMKGIAKDYEYWLANVALILSAAVTGLSSWEGFAGDRELWMQFGHTRNCLRGLQFQLECWKADGCPEPEKKLPAFCNQYQKILDEANTAWLGVRRQGGEKFRVAGAALQSGSAK